MRDPNADNSRGEAWAASDETTTSSWNQYSIRRIAATDTGPIIWNEFAMGLLDDGEILIDDVSLIEDPDGQAIQKIQNGSFTNDTLDTEPAKWRILGNQQGIVVQDPDDASNKALKLTASGPTYYLYNNAETTFAGNTAPVNGVEYEMSFRAKWLRGSNQLNTRIHVARVAATTILDVPMVNGTPGAANSTLVPNIGPTYTDLGHFPVLPNIGDPTVVSVTASDPDGVSSMQLFWSVDGGSWNSTPMAAGANGRFVGTVPGQTTGAVVQFYVLGTDGLGASSMFPATGPESRALFKVNAGQSVGRPVDTIHLLMTATDTDRLFTPTNVMSNQFLGATVIHNGSEVFYDVGARLKGSISSRPVPSEQRNMRVNFHPDQLFRGVHDKIALDGVGPSGIGHGNQDEILIRHLMNHAGGITSLYDDLGHVFGPTGVLTGGVIIVLARYDDIYLEEQFGNSGGDGLLFELELINPPTTTVDGNPESLKLPNPFTDISTDIKDLGDDKEAYRQNFLIKNNRDRDDYARIVEMAKSFSLTGSQLETATNQFMDVDQWMRAFAMQSMTGKLRCLFDLGDAQPVDVRSSG